MFSTLGAGGTLVLIQPEGKRPPLFFAHAIGGEVYSYKELARHLGADQTFYGLQARGLDGKQPPFRKMETMAARYLEEVQRIQPHEPYLLGGYSLGGIIAFEMAQQLYARGYRQIHIMILDEEAPVESPPLSRSALNVARNLPHWFLHHVARRPESELRESIRRNLFKLARRVRRAVKGGKDSSPKAYEVGLAGVLDIKQLPEAHRKVSAALYEALVNYTPQVYPGSLTLFRTRAQPLVNVFGLDKGWKRAVAGEVEVKIVQGNHLDMYEGPNARTLAREIEVFLERKL
jgi:thioesterase domain-containing protein